MNTEKFTGKAEAYASARPGYPQAAIDYVSDIVPPKAVFADIGVGTTRGFLRKACGRRLTWDL